MVRCSANVDAIHINGDILILVACGDFYRIDTIDDFCWDWLVFFDDGYEKMSLVHWLIARAG